MLSDREFRELVESISLEPFTFGAVGFCATCTMPGAMFGDGPPIRAQKLFRVIETSDEILLGCVELAMTLVLHETQERFRVADAVWRDPHVCGDIFDLRMNDRALAPISVATATEAPPDVPASHRLDTGWQPNSTSTVAYWSGSDPRRQRPRPQTAEQRQQRAEASARLAAELARLESMREP
jgi:hypothetical protein